MTTPKEMAENILKAMRDKARQLAERPSEFLAARRAAKESEELARKNEKAKQDQLVKECKAITGNPAYPGFREYLDQCVTECDDLLELCGRPEVSNEQVVSIVRIVSANKKLLRDIRNRPERVIESLRSLKEQAEEVVR